MNLLPNQINAENHLSNWKAGALFMEAGTGKTRVAVEIANSNPVDLVVWVGPLRSVKPKDGLPSIIDEVGKWGGFNSEVVYIGIESIQISDRIYLGLYNKILNAKSAMVIVDESLKIKNADAKRTKRLKELGQMVEYRLILNGTPISKNLMDIKPQMDFISPMILNMSDAEFKNTFCKYSRVIKSFGGKKQYEKEYITGYENIDYLYSLIRHYVFECDLKLNVSKQYNVLTYELSKKEKEDYNYLKVKYLDNEMLMCKNNNIFLEMTQKMQHSYCCSENKFEVLEDLFKKIDPEKTIIYCKYIDSREECEKRFPKATILSYQKESLSLNLQHLNQTVYFDKNWDYALRIQSANRTFRTGQEYDCHYWDLTGDVGLENLIDSNIDKKIGMTEYFKSKTIKELKDIL